MFEQALHAGYANYCELVWREWLEGELATSDSTALRFQVDHLPEPYLLFGSGENPLYVLTTNPGNGIEHQHRANILTGSSIVEHSKKYCDAAKVLATYYTTQLTGPAKNRIDGFMHLATRAGYDGFIQLESCPLHSGSLPSKRKLPQFFQEEPFLKKYVSALKDALRNMSVVGLSAVASTTPITRDTVLASPWLKWQADLIGLVQDEADMLPLTTRNSTPTSALIYSRTKQGVKGLLLMMGGNHLPSAKHRNRVADVYK
ncbi:MAG: hypothetical protein NXI22_12240 [bacterium]|nr:hypothetical protein [bacterium]